MSSTTSSPTSYSDIFEDNYDKIEFDKKYIPMNGRRSRLNSRTSSDSGYILEDLSVEHKGPEPTEEEQYIYDTYGPSSVDEESESPTELEETVDDAPSSPSSSETSIGENNRRYTSIGSIESVPHVNGNCNVTRRHKRPSRSRKEPDSFYDYLKDDFV